MYKSFEKYISNYDAALADLLKASDGLSDAQLNWKPSKKAWSIAQVHSHLLLSEKLSIKYLQKKLPYAADSKKAGIGAWWNFIRLKWALMSPLNLKAPSHVATVPEFVSREDLMRDWKITRVTMKALLETIPEVYATNNLYRHPLTGKFSISNMLQFFVIHIGGHIQQVNRVKSNPDFPK
jgi:hypothetical protein